MTSEGTVASASRFRQGLIGFSMARLDEIASANEDAVRAYDEGDRTWTRSRADMADIAATARALIAEREEAGQRRRLTLAGLGGPSGINQLVALWLPKRPNLSGRAAS